MKNSWAYGIVMVIVLFMAYIIFLVVKTYQLKVDLVSEDYYVQELNYQNQLAKMNNVSEDEKVKWKIMGEEVLFHFPVPNDSIAGTIEFFRPSDSSLDKKIKIAVDKEGKQYLSTTNLVTGLYRVKVDWKENAKDYYMEEDFYLFLFDLAL